MQKVVMSRRAALAGLGAMGSGCRPQKQETAAPTPGSIDTVIVVMMENRSFDHVFGALSLVEGKAVDGLTAGITNPDLDGNPIPIAKAETDCVPDPPHGWNSSHNQYHSGANDGFVKEYQQSEPAAFPGEVMSYQTRETMPVSYALADGSALCERWFASVMGPTWPNRFYGHAGTSAGHQGNELPAEGGFYTFPTIWSKLDEAGVPWRYYYTDLPFLALFQDHVRPETTSLLEQFFFDAANGDLPPVSWVDPGFSFNDDHPPHPVGRGQEFLAALYKALAASPHWENCLLIITYDEHGGFFDHVAPPTTDDDDIADGFDQMGFRIPVVVTGPYVNPQVNSTIFDNTSWIKYICDTYGIAPWTRRIAAANSIATLFDTDRLQKGQPSPPLSLPDFVMDEAGLGDECAGQGVMGPVHQDELAAFIEKYAPQMDRRADAQKILEFLRQKAHH
jgi:phospholipase C